MCKSSKSQPKENRGTRSILVHIHTSVPFIIHSAEVHEHSQPKIQIAEKKQANTGKN